MADKYYKKRYEKHRKTILARNAKWRRENRAHVNEYSRNWYDRNPEHRIKKAAKARELSAALRKEVIEAYGGQCVCCFERNPEFLSIDHILGRKAMGHSNRMKGWQLYQWLKKNGFPKEGFRLLCFNCNCSIGFWGYCPHQRPAL